jgi:hypothetical protein
MKLELNPICMYMVGQAMKLSSYFHSTTIVDFGVMLKFIIIYNKYRLIFFVNAFLINFLNYDLANVISRILFFHRPSYCLDVDVIC